MKSKLFHIIFGISIMGMAIAGAETDLKQKDNKKPQGINVSQDNQIDRIVDGIKDGSLTVNEAATLKEKEEQFAAIEKRLREDGLTKSERTRLENALEKLSEAIYKQKHDGQGQGGNSHPTKGTFPGGINADQEQQQFRIIEGIKSGELTKHEAKTLAEKEAQCAAIEKELRKGGLTDKERARLENMQTTLSREIYQQKYDEQERAGVNERQDNQQDLIKDGVESGELTRHETETLAEKETRLAKQEKSLREDGLDPTERAKLEKEQCELSEDIYKQKHDNQDWDYSRSPNEWTPGSHSDSGEFKKKSPGMSKESSFPGKTGKGSAPSGGKDKKGLNEDEL